MYHSMYEYLEIVSIANTNMYNSGLFVQRQVLTGLNKEEDQQQKNEKEVLKKIEDEIEIPFGAKDAAGICGLLT